MLVLTRQMNEKIIIGEGDSKIIITIVNMRSDRVGIGI